MEKLICCKLHFRKIFEICLTVLKSTPAYWFKCICRELRRFSVCHKRFFGMLRLVTYKIYFRYLFGFPFNVYKTVANANPKQPLLLDRDNNMDRVIETP